MYERPGMQSSRENPQHSFIGQRHELQTPKRHNELGICYFVKTRVASSPFVVCWWPGDTAELPKKGVLSQCQITPNQTWTMIYFLVRRIVGVGSISFGGYFLSQTTTCDELPFTRLPEQPSSNERCRYRSLLLIISVRANLAICARGGVTETFVLPF